MACIRFVLMRSNWNWIEARTKNQIQLWNRNHKILTSSSKLNKTDRQTSARINLLLSFLRAIITCIFTLALFSLFYFILLFFFLFSAFVPFWFGFVPFRAVLFPVVRRIQFLYEFFFFSLLFLLCKSGSLFFWSRHFSSFYFVCSRIWFWCYIDLALWPTAKRARCYWETLLYKMRAQQILIMQWLQAFLTWIS